MKMKHTIIILLCSVITIFYYYSIKDVGEYKANAVYKVYLEGKEIGLIDDDQVLYDLINEEQKEIKEEYNVDNVYPPSDFEIVKINSYDTNLTEVPEIYSMIENKDNFTIKGYKITIKEEDEEEYIYVLEREIFDDAIEFFVDTYIDANIYAEYMNGEQKEIVDTGSIITNMYFAENIRIQENFISVNENIFTSSTDLLSYLIFGDDAKIEKYTVKLNDTISSIADSNKLSIAEFLISNPTFRTENNVLQVGESVNVTLQNPVINFVYEVEKVAQQEIDFINNTEYDNNYGSSYSKVTTPGVVGIDKVTMSYQVTNGIDSQEVEIIDRETIRDVVNQVTTVGVSYSNGSSSGSGSGSSSGSSIVTGLNFTSPVNPGFVVTSPFGEWRSSYRHDGTDFSGTGYNSAIYAIAAGTVTQASPACSGCSLWSLGTYVVISHGSNYYSIYMHMVSSSLKVKVGDKVSMGQQIGGMGSTGWSTGTHLHLGFSVGEPMTSSQVTYYDPYALIFG
ncbi:MAG: peptidoglycan DD-metalloendopeptidase family protein [bacterium]